MTYEGADKKKYLKEISMSCMKIEFFIDHILLTEKTRISDILTRFHTMKESNKEIREIQVSFEDAGQKILINRLTSISP